MGTSKWYEEGRKKYGGGSSGIKNNLTATERWVTRISNGLFGNMYASLDTALRPVSEGMSVIDRLATIDSDLT